MKKNSAMFLKRLSVMGIVIVLCSTGISLFSSVEACENMVSCWPLDETLGTIAHDAFNGNDGTLSCCPIWTSPGKVNGALWFDGIDDKVVVPDSPSLHLTTFTVMAWAKIDGKFDAWRSILTKDSVGGSEFWFGYGTNNKLDFKFNGGSDRYGTTAIVDEEWHMLVGTFDGTYISLYIDGVLDNTPVMNEPMSIGSGSVNMGITLKWGDNCFRGMLDEVAIFNYALPAGEIAALYDLGRQGVSYCVEPPVSDPNGPYRGDCDEPLLLDGSGSYDPDAVIVSYEWDFGDGSSGTGIAPSHTYADDGVYTVTLTVTDDDGLMDANQTTVTISCDACVVDLAVNKTVWDGIAWVDEIRVANGTLLKFRINITNNADCPLEYFTVVDYLSAPQLEYVAGSAVPTAEFESAHEVRWVIENLGAGDTLTILYNASAVHTCYGSNIVYVKECQGTIIGYDVARVKVVDPGQPVLDITKLVWDESKQQWTDYITLIKEQDLRFKLTIRSTDLSAVYNVIVTDTTPLFMEYNNDATLLPTSQSTNQMTWDLGDMAPGDDIEIIYTATTVNTGNEAVIARVTADQGYYDESSVLLGMDSPPTIALLYPIGDETLFDRVQLQWAAQDSRDGRNLPISLLLYNVVENLWSEFPDNPYENTGMLNWDTTVIPDGTYQILIKTTDLNNNRVNFISQPFQIKNTKIPTENLAPTTPNAPQGSSEGKPGVQYLYSSSTSDPEDDPVYYLWNWGDGTQSDWIGPYTSGAIVEISHIWQVKGSFSITVKAKDSNGHESSWSDPLPITLTSVTKNPIMQVLELLFERYPHLFPFLQRLLGF